LDLHCSPMICLYIIFQLNKRRITMWTKPTYTEMRFGFEVTMYIANR
jgi:coenzyme PQQ precursor peptide PqqA